MSVAGLLLGLALTAGFWLIGKGIGIFAEVMGWL